MPVVAGNNASTYAIEGVVVDATVVMKSKFDGLCHFTAQ
jgi:hypothetical protein